MFLVKPSALIRTQKKKVGFVGTTPTYNPTNPTTSTNLLPRHTLPNPSTLQPSKLNYTPYQPYHPTIDQPTLQTLQPQIYCAGIPYQIFQPYNPTT